MVLKIAKRNILEKETHKLREKVCFSFNKNIGTSHLLALKLKCVQMISTIDSLLEDDSNWEEPRKSLK